PVVLAAPQPVLDCGGLLDGYLLRHRGAGAAVGTVGRGLWDPAGAFGDRVSGQPGARLLDAAGGIESFVCQLALPQARPGSLEGSASYHRSTYHRGPAHHLRALAYHGAATLAGEIKMTATLNTEASFTVVRGG